MATTRRTLVLSAVLGAALLAAACRGREAPSSDEARGAMRDEIGRLVVPRHAPTKRLVSLAPNLTELLFAIGAGDQVVGVDRYSDQPVGAVERLPNVGTDYEPSLESIVALSPDLVLLSKSANRRETADALERLGVPTFITDTPALVDLDRTLRDLGSLTGHPREANAQIAAMHAGFDAVRRRVAGSARPRVLVVVWPEPLYVAGRGTFTHDLVEMAGGRNVAAEAQGYATFPLERVLHLAPEIIVLPTHAPRDKDSTSVAYWSRWSSLPAVMSHRIFPIEDAILSRPGARLAAGAALLARLIHPEIPERD
jgi:iron complex transport system substrate-binding protein